MEPGIIVKNIQTSEIGVSVWDAFGRAKDGEESIVYSGTDSCVSVNRLEIEIIEKYDIDVASFEKCTTNRGEKICKYLGRTASETTCLRFSKKRNEIIFSLNKKAKLSPNGLYPDCQRELSGT